MPPKDGSTTLAFVGFTFELNPEAWRGMKKSRIFVHCDEDIEDKAGFSPSPKEIKIISATMRLPCGHTQAFPYTGDQYE